MTPSPLKDAFIATKLMPKVPRVIALYRSRTIDDALREECLTPNGSFIFSSAVLCYLARCREEGDELASKARAFLRLAHSVGERQKYDYASGYNEGVRSAELSYLDWLVTGEVDGMLLADARANLDSYYSQSKTFSWASASYIAPTLLYTESYLLIPRLAKMLPARTGQGGSGGSKGLFGHALRIALAEDETQRQIAKENLRKKIFRQILAWIDNGLYTNVAFALHALFPRPNNPPCRLIEECWIYISEYIINQWQNSQ